MEIKKIFDNEIQAKYDNNNKSIKELEDKLKNLYDEIMKADRRTKKYKTMLFEYEDIQVEIRFIKSQNEFYERFFILNK